MLAWESLPELFPDFPEPERWVALLRRHADLLAEAPVRTTTVTGEEVVARHYAESLEAYRLAGAPGEGVAVDVGSGGGFPGLVIAAVAPGLAVHLVEARRKRADLLAEMAEALGLANVTAHGVRAEGSGAGGAAGQRGARDRAGSGAPCPSCWSTRRPWPRRGE